MNYCKKCGFDKLVTNGNKDDGSKRLKCVRCGAESVTSNPTVMAFSDTHNPFMYPNYEKFLKDVYDQYRPDIVVINGDFTDHHAISRHNTEPDAYGAKNEYKMAKAQTDVLKELFPHAVLVRGNHDDIPFRQGKELGMMEEFIKPLEELYDLPDTWEVCTEKVINGVYYYHGVGAGGKNPALNLAMNNRMSCVCGHWHSVAGVHYHANPNDLIFGLDLGCGFDASTYAARYGKALPKKPIIGCGIIKSSSEAYFIPMDKEKYSDL